MSIYQKKIRFFEWKIMDFYRKAGREHLPWRRSGISAYEVWVSEIMLQQTQVSRVIDYYERFLERFPTVYDLAKASWEEFMPYYAGLGYYRRGKNMLLAAQKVVEEYDGEFPKDKKLLMSLPGIGDYTASAILSFAYDDNHLAWDTNLKRVIGRFFFGSKKTFDISLPKERGLENIFSSPVDQRECKAPKKCSSKPLSDITNNLDSFENIFVAPKKDMNAALMDFGSAICLGRPKCGACPLAKECVYFQESGKQEQTGVNKKQSNEKMDWRMARVFLWLHQDHTIYYSSHSKKFEVFVLPFQYNSRAGIKKYFKEKYDLDLAVRPPHKKIVVRGEPTLFVNAQILLGEPNFLIVSKEVVKLYNKEKFTD